MPNLPIETWTYLFNSSVAPVMLYGAEIWGCELNEKVDITENKFLRYILGLPQSTPACIIRFEINKPLALHHRALLRSLSYWLKISEMPDDRLPKLAYKEQHRLRDGWGANIVKCLDYLGCKELWEVVLQML